MKLPLTPNGENFQEQTLEPEVVESEAMESKAHNYDQHHDRLCGIILQPDWKLPEAELEFAISEVLKGCMNVAQMPVLIDCQGEVGEEAILIVSAIALNHLTTALSEGADLDFSCFDSTKSEQIQLFLASLPHPACDLSGCRVKEIRGMEAMQAFSSLLEEQPVEEQPKPQNNALNSTDSPAYYFQQDWFSHNVPIWNHVIHTLLKWDLDTPKTIVEIGSFEGLSSCWIALNLLAHPQSRLYCIDPFEGSDEHDSDLRNGLYERFLNNIQVTGKQDQIEVVKNRSDDGLIRLIAEGNVAADLIYIDGSHYASDVLSDAVLSWKLLKPGGVMIFDDYLWDTSLLESKAVSAHPKFGVDAFVNTYFQMLDLLVVPGNYQCIIRKRIL